MANTSPAGAQPPRKKSRLKRFVLIPLATIVVAAGAAHLIYKYSGSNQWEALPERDGIKAFSMKTPGDTLVKYKGITRFHASLGSITRFMQDPSTCDDVGCTDPVVLDTESPQVQHMSFVYDYGPFGPREFVVKVDVSQDPKTKEVLVQYVGDPNRIPPNKCCVRVPHMNNSWRFRPLGNGDVEVEYVIDMYEGGMLPYFLDSGIHEHTVYMALGEISKFVLSDKFKQKYGDVKLDFIQEASSG